MERAIEAATKFIPSFATTPTQPWTWSCGVTRSEILQTHFIPDPSYFVREPFIKLELIVIRERDCSNCISSTALCKGRSVNGSTQQLQLEYIALEFALDTEITTQRSLWNKHCSDGQMCHHSTSTQEFILKEYLHGQYPDVLFYFASIHDIVRYSMREIPRVYDSLFVLMDIYLPNTTTAIFMNAHNEKPSLAPPVWQHLPCDNGNLDCTEARFRQNSIMYRSLEKYLPLHDRQWYVFPSLFDSLKATDDLYVDNVHRTPEWYEYIIGNLLSIIAT